MKPIDSIKWHKKLREARFKVIKMWKVNILFDFSRVPQNWHNTNVNVRKRNREINFPPLAIHIESSYHPPKYRKLLCSTATCFEFRKFVKMLAINFG